MKNKILIIGSNGLIGSNITQYLIEHELNVIGIDKNINRSFIKNANFEGLKVNLSNKFELKEKIKLIKSSKIQAVIFCQRFSSSKTNKKKTGLDFGTDEVIDVEVKASIEIIELLISNKLLLKNSRLIFITSTNAIKISQQSFFYHASKSMTEILIKWLSDRLKQLSINVNGIRIGLVDLNLKKKENIFSKTTKSTCIDNRGTQLEEITNLLMYLIFNSPKHLNSEIINLNGGYLNSDPYYNLKKLING